MAIHADVRPKLTIDAFFAAYSGCEEKYELVDGEPRMMAGARRRHGRIMRNLIRRLAERLEAGPYEVFGPDMGLEIDVYNYRLPDVAIYCDPRDLDQDDEDRIVLSFPKVVFEVLSRSTRAVDYGVKLGEYQALPSVDTIVFVHRDQPVFTTFERTGDNEWRSVVHLPGQPLILRDPAVTITAEEIFAGTGGPPA